MVGLSAMLALHFLGVLSWIFYTFHFLGEYFFAYRLLAGCRNYASGEAPSPGQRLAGLLVLVLAFALPWMSHDLSAQMAVHCLAMTGFFIAAFLTLRSAPRRFTGPGLRVISIALIALSIDFLHYALLCSYSAVSGHALTFTYLKYSPLYDLILDTLLGFGMVMIVMESVCRQLEEANRHLESVGAKLRVLAEQDPLTKALNRHAFDAILQNRGTGRRELAPGSVVLVDVDDFKQINDRLGHPVGDAALRAVAKAIRSLIRADDLLFRWGGDEFLIVLSGLGEPDARIRLEKLNAAVLECCLTDSDPRGVYHVSYGVASFEDPGDIAESIEHADQEMYAVKQARKAREKRNSPQHILIGV
jgi:diguanylate cyclase (GGDEF)-like protein